MVTTGKYVEYALLAPAAALLVRRVEDPLLLLLASSPRASSRRRSPSFSSSAGESRGGWPAGYRQPSFLGHHDFASLSGLALTIALAAIALPGGASTGGLRWRPAPAGVVGLLVSGSIAGAIGLLAAGVVAAVVARASARRAGGDRRDRGRGARRSGPFPRRRREVVPPLRRDRQAGGAAGVESYVQRTMLVYYGWRVFLDHPLAGAGWQASNDEYVYGPLLPTLHREFPNTPQTGVPVAASTPTASRTPMSRRCPTSAWSGSCSSSARCSRRSGSRRGPVVRGPPDVSALVPVSWLLVTMGVLTAIGLVAGIPLDAMLWIAAGLCAAPPLLAEPAAAGERAPSPAPHPGWGAVPPPSTGNGTADLRA